MDQLNGGHDYRWFCFDGTNSLVGKRAAHLVDLDSGFRVLKGLVVNIKERGLVSLWWLRIGQSGQAGDSHYAAS